MALIGGVRRELDDRRGGLGWTAIHHLQDAAYRHIARVDAQDHCGNCGGKNDCAEDQIVQSC